MPKRSLALIFVATALSGCLTRGLTNRQHKTANNTLMGITGALLACDYGQTLYAAHDGWDKHKEHNPLLGTSPTTSTLTAYFMAIMTVGGVASAKAPEWLRSTIYTTVLIGQTTMVLGNHYLADIPWCGLQ